MLLKQRKVKTKDSVMCVYNFTTCSSSTHHMTFYTRNRNPLKSKFVGLTVLLAAPATVNRLYARLKV